MRRLLILRHAKAGPHDENHDRERQLIDRGRTDCALVGRMMREKEYVPALVLCSSAMRTRETWEHTSPELHAKAETIFLDALYDASAGTILDCLHRAAATPVLYIGHNPGLENLARMLVRDPQGAEEMRRTAALMSKYPTAALTVIDFPADSWREIALGAGILVDFVMPADLKNK